MSLSTSEVDGLAETLATGKHPKVVFTEAAGQIAGKVGKVVRFDEPAEDDFIIVQFGHDELPFSVTELRVPKRGELSRKATAKKAAPSADDQQPAGPPLLENSDGDANARPQKPKEQKSMSQSPDAAVPQQSTGQDAESAPAPRKKAAKPKPTPDLSVTLAYKTGEWVVSAAKGAKVIAKPVPVKAAMALDMVQSLDSPAVSAVVEDIVEQQRQQALQEAERLREELAAAEARLAELK